MFWLIFNHVDAWGMTFIIAAMSLALRGALTGETLTIPFALALGAWFAFALNDRFDAPYDAHEPEKARRNVFARGTGVPSSTTNRRPSLDLLLALCCAVLAVIYAGFGGRGVAVGLVGLTAAWAYSGTPLRLKTRPGFDLFTHAAFVETFPYLTAVILAGAPLLPFDLLAWAILALTSLSAQLEQQARDFEVDSKLERNFTTVVGLAANHRLLSAASLLLLFSGTAGALTGIIPPVLWPGMALTVPMIVHRLLRPPGTPRSEPLIRASLAGGAVYIAAIMLAAL
jgi:1,4-dihydroxy-2-naphthoate octaprenyltransferase